MEYPYPQEAGAIWLDSTLAVGDKGHRSAIAHQPQEDWCYQQTIMTRRTGSTSHQSPTTLHRFFDELHQAVRDTGRTAVGYVTYEATHELLGLSVTGSEPAIPAARFFLFDSVTWHTAPLSAETQQIPYGKQPVAHCSVTRAEYERALEIIRHHLHEGDIYQANYTARWHVLSDEPPFSVYARLRRLNPSPYGAYLDFGDYQILSSSPERMIRWHGDRLVTSPIKGTVALGRTALEEQQNRAWLLASEKDRAEHLMIVDLERNDLGRIARPGTVSVVRFCEPERYVNLIHLVSDIAARNEANCTLGSLMQAILPGGSITGAPKRRAVEILRRLEVAPRSVYTGCIGYISPQEVEFNIAIRTVLHQNGRYCVYAGGGIVADSLPAAEYDEMVLKAERMLLALGVTL